MRRSIVRAFTIVAGALLGAVLGAWLAGERGRLMRRSTWRLMRAGGLRRVVDRTFLHAYVYARWPRLYIGTALTRNVPRLNARERRSAADHYHGKVLTVGLAQALVSVREDIPLRDLERIIPYPIARSLVLQGPPEIAVLECPCRHTRADPCRPTDVCMIVGQPFVDFVLEHHPRDSRRITTSEAVTLLQAEHARGHIHAAYFKDAMLDRFYAICNCCKCCCGGIEAMVRYGIPMITSSGYVARVDPEECQACGTCADACPFGAITVDATAAVSWDACMGCGVCEGQCPNGAMQLVRDERKGTPLDVQALAAR